jgi:hypothetical protein
MFIFSPRIVNSHCLHEHFAENNKLSHEAQSNYVSSFQSIQNIYFILISWACFLFS